MYPGQRWVPKLVFYKVLPHFKLMFLFTVILFYLGRVVNALYLICQPYIKYYTLIWDLNSNL